MLATFQCLIEKVLVGLQYKLLALYLDYVVVFLHTVYVLDFCRQAGQLVDKDGVHMDPDKVQIMLDWNVAMDIHQV